MWLLTGVWHGANWTFIIWGLLYFIILVFEKKVGLDKDSNNKVFNGIRHVYLIFFVIIGWVIFRSDNLESAYEYIKCMFDIAGINSVPGSMVFYLREYWIFFVVGVIVSCPVLPYLKDKIGGRMKNKVYFSIIISCTVICIFVLSISYIVKGSYNPFIYFNF